MEQIVGEQLVPAGIDRISILPDHLSHKILANLSTKNAARMSVLSQRWNSLWTTFPTIDLNERDFLDKEKFLECLELRLLNHDMKHLENLRIHLVNYINEDLCHLIDEFVHSAIEGKAKEMRLMSTSTRFSNGSQIYYYLLPEVTFTSGAFFKSLTFEGCKFEAHGNFINFPFLKEIVIKHCVLTQTFFTALIHGSPEMKTLSLKYCEGLKGIKFSHSKVKSLVFGCNKTWEMFEVDAPDLESFKYSGFYYYHNLNENHFIFEPWHTIRSPKLVSLSMKYAYLRAEMLQRLVSSFPNLEKMVIRCCKIFEGSKISGRNLQSLVIRNCDFEEEIKITAPTLQTLECNANHLGSQWSDFKYLRKLFLGNIIMKDEAFYVSESDLPLLETLDLISCKGFQLLKIISSNLKSFRVLQCKDVKECNVNAPNLVSLNYTGPVVNFSQLLVSDELQAMVHITENHSSCSSVNPMRFLQVFACARALTLIMFDKSVTDVYQTTSSTNRKSWEVKRRYDVASLVQTVSSLLCSSRHPKTLAIQLRSTSIELEFQDADAQKVKKGKTNCIEEHLEEVTIENFKGDNDDMMLVEFLCAKAVHLRKMDLFMTGESKIETEMHLISKVSGWRDGLSKAFPVVQITINQN